MPSYECHRTGSNHSNALLIGSKSNYSGHSEECFFIVKVQLSNVDALSKWPAMAINALIASLHVNESRISNELQRSSLTKFIEYPNTIQRILTDDCRQSGLTTRE